MCILCVFDLIKASITDPSISIQIGALIFNRLLSSFLLQGKNFQPNPRTVEASVEASGSNFTPRRPCKGSDEDADETEDRMEGEEQHYDLSTPTVLGRAGIPKSLSVRRTSNS
ncbi:uncharacterized protein PGTG_08042 [Puccinia graminis f. sp. tritici CRL 75-36-700-3]|uniref:Uncharacterized protein n=1 Tax=Puccinia graminis f. sp. tritici (strain CRL 75-36-700-3 / race SCCL) TaxID=418459 RepID=E3KC02_PUCGT|nr:uncharacterized protein PGTG_08042 [Puccinia graminis f. sp. tritici CRL 75-36-700-3]EFP81793.2 hypothetical protein PGTG_08042 [Puccinia graminis f. sp. tritici CRL 75-36-700-3]